MLGRTKFARILPPARREAILDLLWLRAVWCEPVVAVNDCRDANDNKYLELALGAGATMIVSSDDDLLSLSPWRGIPIVTPRAYLTAVEAL